MDYKDYKAGCCSAFWFRAKNDFISSLLSKNLKGRSRLKILSLGSGTGDDLKILSSYGDVYVTDIDEKALSLIPDGLYFEKVCADACSLPYESGFFDVVTSFDVFEHIKDDSKAVSEAYRVLKDGGFLFFSVPASELLFSSHDIALGHERRYNKKTLGKLFSSFPEKRFGFWNFFLFPPLLLFRLFKKNSEPKTDFFRLPKFIDSLFYFLLKAYTFLFGIGIPLPFGVTLAGYCRK